MLGQRHCNPPGKSPNVKNMIIVAKVFAFLNLLFVPSIAILVFIAFAVGERWWFSFIGVPTLFANLIILLVNPFRGLIWQKLEMIVGLSFKR